MININFPYTMCNYIEPMSKCMTAIEILDIDMILKTFKLCGTDVLFMQDKYLGPTIPYNSIMLAQEDVENTIPEHAPTFITVFNTPWIEEVFMVLQSMFGFEIIHNAKLNVSLAMSDECIGNTNIVNTITLFDISGNITLNTIAGMVFQYKHENDCFFNISDIYWTNVFGYILVPTSIRNNYEKVQNPIRCNFAYADV